MRGNVDVGGDISVELGPQHGKLLKHAFGLYTKTGAAAPYIHTFKIGDLPVGLTVEKRFLDLATPKYFKYAGCRINTMKMSLKTEGVIDCSFTLMGRSEVVGAATFVVTPSDLGLLPFDGFGAALYVGESNVETSLAVCTALDFTLENGLDGNTYVIGGAGARRSLPEGIAKVTGTATMLFEDSTLYTDAIAFTEKSFRIEFISGTGVGNTSGNEKMEIYLPEIIFKPSAPAVSGPTGVTWTADFEAFYFDDSVGSAAWAKIWSPTADYDI
jgi:hypothetical protein